nr:hypothetical protein [Tanacetum cinerariifolium]
YSGEIGIKGTLKKSCVPPGWRLLMGQITQCLGVVAEMHKEDQQAAGGLTSLGFTNEEGSQPQLNSENDASADFTAEADTEIFAPNDNVPHQQGPDKGSKNYTPDHTLAGTNPSVLVDTTKSARDGSQTAHPISCTKVDTRSAFMDNEDQDNEPFIALEESSEENDKINKDTHAKHKSISLQQDKQKAQPVFPKINQLTEHLVSSMKLEFSKLLSFYDFSSSIPAELKEFPTKITALSREVNELKKHIKEFENELPETLEALLGLLNKVTNTLNMFSSILNAHNKGVLSAGKLIASLTEGEKNTNPVTEDAELANLVDLIGIDVVEEYNKKKLLYNKYCDKILKRKKP